MNDNDPLVVSLKQVKSALRQFYRPGLRLERAIQQLNRVEKEAYKYYDEQMEGDKKSCR